ncbi:thiamine pyrophosphate-dependent dehydrogenase E1 component subunit alpha [Paenibacillus jiagnxiensis]|uniref:thiamine pyrophosphate-dependent dehydrogenase E1 component subunit alpha n=1 Tax=Paenibacillus jiagnxiensis TaxID=3228926 RepID=UPI00339E7B66
MYRDMALARKVDERLGLFHRAGKIPFHMSCQGHEAAQVGAAYALDMTKDFLCPYDRDMGMAIVFGMTAKELMLTAFAKAEAADSGGRQMPGHYGSKKNRILSTSGLTTTHVPHAVGIALAGKIRGDHPVVLVAFGNGGSHRGEFHEAANFAGGHKLPVIFFCEQNQPYGLSVLSSKQTVRDSVADRAKAYGFPGIRVSGNDPLEVYRVTKEAVDRANRGEGPTLIEAGLYRLAPYPSDDDDQGYRSSEEIEEAEKYDPLESFSRYLRKSGILEEHAEQEIHDRIVREIDEAAEYAELTPDPALEDIFKHVYSN